MPRGRRSLSAISENDTAVRKSGSALSVKTKTEIPYSVEVTLVGEAPILFHRWDCDAVESKAKAKKNSAEKKTDNIESYVYRCEDGTIGVPGTYLKSALVAAAKFSQDPRSPRKSACDLFKAGVIVTTEMASLGMKEWEFEDRRRVTIQRNGITRIRPGVRAGWRVEFGVDVILPEYIDIGFFQEVLGRAGRFCGFGDFRPEFGRFRVERCEVV